MHSMTLFGWTMEQWAVVLWQTQAPVTMRDYIDCFQYRGLWYFNWVGQEPPDGWIARNLATPEYQRLARDLFEDMAARDGYGYANR